MVKSTVQESLDEAFEQRLSIMDEPWAADYRFAESRLSRRDQYAVRHGQRRPSSEVRNRIKQRKPLPENKHDCYKHEHVTSNEEKGIPDITMTSPTRIEHEANEWEQQQFLDGASVNDPVGACRQRALDSPTAIAQVGTSCDLPPNQSCLPNDHAWAPDGPTRHSDVTAEVRESSFSRAVQNCKRKLTDSPQSLSQTKRVRNNGSKGNDVTQENKSCFKRQHEPSGDSHYSGKRQRPQLWLGQPKDDESEDVAEEIRVVVDSMTVMLSSLQEPQTHSHQFNRALVNSARVRHKRNTTGSTHVNENREGDIGNREGYREKEGV